MEVGREGQEALLKGGWAEDGVIGKRGEEGLFNC